jgi:hypothetical protein
MNPAASNSGQESLVAETIAAYKAYPVGTRWHRLAQCRLAISVGQAYHEGEKLRATLQWIGRHAGNWFKACEIVIGDSLQRHNLVDLSCMRLGEAAARARAEGDRWLERNESALRTLPMPLRLIRWDEVLADARFPAALTGLQCACVEDPVLEASIQADGLLLLDRWRARSSNPPGRPEVSAPSGETNWPPPSSLPGAMDADRFLHCCRNYLLEEISGMALLQVDFPAITCYPGTWLRTWEVACHSAAVRSLPSLADLELVTLHLRRRHRFGD